MTLASDPVKRRLNSCWANMRRRCANPLCVSYDRYGGRGITVCDEWQVFEVFYQWAMENGYVLGLSIDRIDNDGSYSPENCRWISRSDNSVLRQRPKQPVQKGVCNEGHTLVPMGTKGRVYCPECRKAAHKANYAVNRDEIIDKAKAYHQENRERRLAQMRQRYATKKAEAQS